MRNRRLAIAGLVLTTAIGLTGCARTSDGTPSGATTRSADPTAELADAAVKLTQQSMKVTMELTGGLRMTGVADPKADKAQMEMTIGTGAGAGTDGTAQIRKIGKDMWMRFSGSMGALDGLGKGKWMHLDISTLGDGSAFGISGSDPAAAAKMIKAASNVKRTGDHRYSGVLDLTKAQTVDSKVVGSLGEKAKAVPFTATTDDQGRIIEMTVDLTGIGPATGVLKTTYSDFGTPVSVTAPPASDVRELPAQLKGILGGN
jgi:hypothetical protein